MNLLTSLSPRAYKRVPALTRKQIREALDRGRRDIERAAQTTRRPRGRT